MLGMLIISLLVLYATGAEITDYKRVCYYASWSSYREGPAKYSADNLTDLSICTHYIYSFAGVDPINKTIIPLEDIDESGGYSKLTGIKEREPSVKVLLGLGGLGFGVESFAVLSNSTEFIDEFCVNAVIYLRKWHFDGVDIGWAYPTKRGGYPEDRDNYVTLLQKLRQKFENESAETGKARLLLTAAVPIFKTIIDDGYNRKLIGESVDFLNINIYDLSDSKTLGHHAPLYPRNGGTHIEQIQNVEWGLAYWAENISKEKLTLGLPLYARTYTLWNSSLTHQGDPANGTGSPGPYLKAPGVLSYYEVCKLIKTGVLTEEWDEKDNVPYAYSETDWAGYDNERSAKSKANYVKDHQFGGVNIWELSFDDFSGQHCENGKYPFINILKKTLTEAREECQPGTHGSLNKMGCTLCTRNTYQPNTSQITCIDCRIGEITKTQGATDDQKCILDCASGWEFDYTTKRCVVCSVGFYRRKPDSVFCLKCETGFTTVSTGSKKCVKIPEDLPTIKLNKVEIKAEMKFSTKHCTNKLLLQNVIITIINEVLVSLSQTWNGICTNECGNAKIGTVTGCDSRRKRAIPIDNVLNVEVLIKNVPQEVTNGRVTRTTESVIGEYLNEREHFNKLTDYMLVYGGTFSVSSRVVCQVPNQVVQNNICVPCPRGSYYNSVTSTCNMCDRGSYQDNEGLDSCNPCPNVLTTKHVGSDNRSLCISPCTDDLGYCKHNGKCVHNDIMVSCSCYDGYVGVYCENKKEVLADKTLLIAVGVGGVLAVLLIILTIVSFCACWKFSRRPRKYEEMKHKIGQLKGKKESGDNKNLALVKVGPSADVSMDYFYDYHTLRAIPTITKNPSKLR